MIRYLEAQKLLALETDRTSYLISLQDPAPLCLYWGEKIAAEDGAAIAFQTVQSSFDMEIWRERLEYPSFDGRTFVNPAIKADIPLVLTFRQVDVSGNTAVITLGDDDSGLALRLHYRVDARHDVLIRHAEVQAGGVPLTLSRLDSGACCLPPAAGPWTAHYTAGAWGCEFQRRSAELAEGELRLGSERGMSGHHMAPFLIAAQGDEEETGLACCCALGWSGSWQITAATTIFGHSRITAGFSDHDLTLTLAPGERVSTPPMYLCLSAQGLGGLSRRMHDFQRDVLTASCRPRRVLYNSWEATEFSVRVQEQMALADRAAAMGVELFVVDDGWFGQRHSDRAGLGDWYVNQEKFPHGLEELIDHVKGLGMDFGLWVEPEAVNPDSDLYRAHPDWIHRLSGIEPIQLRNQYLLDFGKPEVEAFAIELLRGLLRRYDISYIKWDMNRPMTDVAERLTPFARERHILAVYRILETLRREFPLVDVEDCSGGGGRVDLGMIARTGQFWASDNTDPYDRLMIQEGCSLLFAPVLTSCWVTDTPSRARRAGRDDLRYKFHVAMEGTLGIGANINRLTDGQLAICREEISRYKTLRHVIHQGDLYRLLLPTRENLAATEYCAKDGSEAVLLLFLHSQRSGRPLPRVTLRGLDADARYRLSGTEETFAGSTLMRLGIQPMLSGDFDSQVLHFVKL